MVCYIYAQLDGHNIVGHRNAQVLYLCVLIIQYMIAHEDRGGLLGLMYSLGFLLLQVQIPVFSNF